MKICTVEQNRNFDLIALKKYGIPSLLLMEDAAQALLSAIEDRFQLPGLRVLIIAGPGNNGGDGYALARLLLARGALPEIFFWKKNPASPEGNQNAKLAQSLGVPVQSLDGFPLEKEVFSHFSLCVDALFGTGLFREIPNNLHLLINQINAAPLPVLAVDIPSGIHGDSGKILGCAFKADFTVTFGTAKPGHFLYPGAENAGEILVSPLCFPPSVLQEAEPCFRVNLKPQLPKRPVDGHKGTFGKVLVVSGSRTYRGAPFFAAQAALLSGAGYVFLACPESLTDSLAIQIPEAVMRPLPETASGGIALSSLEILREMNAEVLLIGPGLGRDPETLELVQRLVSGFSGMMVVDGDGLAAIKKLPPSEKWVLTPHPGELSHMLGCSLQEILENPLEKLEEAHRRWNGSIVLKGAHSLIAAGRSLYVNTTGNSGMGTAGSGDVLSGMVAGLAAYSMQPEEALLAAVYLHGCAGDLSAEMGGERSVTASSILDRLPDAFKPMEISN